MYALYACLHMHIYIYLHICNNVAMILEFMNSFISNYYDLIVAIMAISFKVLKLHSTCFVCQLLLGFSSSSTITFHWAMSKCHSLLWSGQRVNNVDCYHEWLNRWLKLSQFWFYSFAFGFLSVLFYYSHHLECLMWNNQYYIRILVHFFVVKLEQSSLSSHNELFCF